MAESLVVALLAVWLSGASAIPLSKFYPYGVAAGDILLPSNDDGSSPAITLSRPFSFFGTRHLRLFVNNNGDISFDTSVSAFTPSSFPLSGNLQLIAPFWGDVLTPPGSVWYREASSNSAILKQAQSDAQRYFMGLRNFRPSFVFIATWERVGYFGIQTNIDRTNTFQCVLVSDGARSFVYFLYADGLIQWTRGTASDVDAQVGFNAGDGVRFAAVPESQTAAIGNIDETTNVGVNGVWAFRVDREQITVSTCDADEPIALNPLHGSMLGGTGVFIDICEALNDGQRVQCKFENEDIDDAVILNRNLAVCVSPLLQRTGYVPLQVMITGKPTVKTQFLSMSPETSHAVSFSGSNGLLLSDGDEVTLKWSPEDLVPSRLDNNITVDVSVQVQFMLNSNRFRFNRDYTDFLKNNNGLLKIDFRSTRIHRCPATTGKFVSVCPLVFKISISDSQYLPSTISIWSGMAFLKSKDVSDSEIVMQCDSWRNEIAVSGDMALFSELPACPPTLPLAIFDVNYQRESMVSSVTSDTSYHQSFMEYFHPNISTCYRQSIPHERGPGQQCCYEKGILVKKPRGGSADRESPLRSFNLHVLTDLLPYILCCKGGTSVCTDTYYQARPEGSDMGYRLPVPACVYGDPHIVTLDGHKYTFNGKGEFILIQTSTNLFALQGRMEQVSDAEGNASPGTVFTAIMARHIPSNTSVQFEVNRIDASILVLVSGQEAIFDNLPVLEYDNVVLLNKGNNTVQALFSSGANVEISVLNGIINVMLVALPESMKRTTSGLMGSYNDITSDDLLPRNGGDVVPLDSNLEDIHHNFGITWIISRASESYFAYGPGENWMTYYFPNFVPMFAPSFTDDSLEEEARLVCGDDSFCLFDVAATKRVEIGAATMEGQEMLNTIMEMSQPIVCSPVCENGVCLENNTCSCDDGYAGNRCNEPVLEVCDTNPCQNNGNCSKLASSVRCSCTSQYTGSLCQTKVPPFQISLVNGSPRVAGNTISMEFTSSKPANYRCALDGRILPCSRQSLSINNVTEGVHNFRLIAKTEDNERHVLRRKIYIGHCVVQLINNGLSVDKNDVTVEFTRSLPDVDLSCRLDDIVFDASCRSPLRLNDLSPGEHKLAIKPTCGRAIAIRFKI